jgi:hypothetical protein
VSISSSGGIAFDALVDIFGDAVYDSYHQGPALGVPGGAGLGTVTNPLQPGMYFIRIYGTTPSTVGTWTLKIAS